MPELPEVETTRLGLTPHLQGRRMRTAVVRNRNLRWPVPRKLPELVAGRTIERLDRRSKYLLLDCGGAWLIFHLGMSGSLRVVPAELPPGPHDHVDLVLDNGRALRLHDPRRFGAVLWQPGEPGDNKLLQGLAPEPLENGFSELVVRARAGARRRSRTCSWTTISYAVWVTSTRTSPFRAGKHPIRAAGRIGQPRYVKLVEEIRATLRAAIEAGGSTLRDFVHADGSPGYFQQNYFVYGRAGEQCRQCGTPIKTVRIGQRSAFYCPSCQR